MGKVKRLLFSCYLWGSVSALILILCGLIVFLVSKGFFAVSGLVEGNTYFNTLGSMLSDLLPAIVGTISITLFSVLIATPAGILTGIYINEYSKGRKKEIYIFLFKLLSGIPSIVIGLYGFLMILILNSIFAFKLRACFLISGVSLAILILPYIVHSTVIALQSVSPEKRIVAISLGAKKYQNIFRVLIPESLTAISTGIILSIGRAAEDTAVIMLTGVAAVAGMPSGLLSSYEALPFFIYYQSSEYMGEFELTKIFIAAIIIIIISISFISLANYINLKLEKKMKHE